MSLLVKRKVDEVRDHELLDELEALAGKSWWDHLWHGPFDARRNLVRDELERRLSMRARAEGT